MKGYILEIINRALSGDGVAIFQCVAVLFVIHILYRNLRDSITMALRKGNTKDMTRSPSRSKLLENGYSRNLGNTPTRSKTGRTTQTKPYRPVC